MPGSVRRVSPKIWAHRATLLALSLGAFGCLAFIRAEADPLEKPVVGPMIVCFKYSAFALAAGERITDFSSSPEGMRIAVDGPRGRFSIVESEIFARLRGGRALVKKDGQISVFKVEGRPRRYAIFGPTKFSNGADSPIVLLEGDALRGDAEAVNLFDRVEIRDPSSEHCGQTFTYGWTF